MYTSVNRDFYKYHTMIIFMTIAIKQKKTVISRHQWFIMIKLIILSARLRPGAAAGELVKYINIYNINHACIQNNVT